MASKYPRLGVARDPELERALAQTRKLLAKEESRSAAAQVRALALRGARSVLEEAGAEGELRRRLADEHGASPARHDLLSIGRPSGKVKRDDPTPASDALSWVRGR